MQPKVFCVQLKNNCTQNCTQLHTRLCFTFHYVPHTIAALRAHRRYLVTYTLNMYLLCTSKFSHPHEFVRKIQILNAIAILCHWLHIHSRNIQYMSHVNFYTRSFNSRNMDSFVLKSVFLFPSLIVPPKLPGWCSGISITFTVQQYINVQ